MTDSAVPLHFQFPPTINLPVPACVATPRLAYSRRKESSGQSSRRRSPRASPASSPVHRVVRSSVVRSSPPSPPLSSSLLLPRASPLDNALSRRKKSLALEATATLIVNVASAVRDDANGVRARGRRGERTRAVCARLFVVLHPPRPRRRRRRPPPSASPASESLASPSRSSSRASMRRAEPRRLASSSTRTRAPLSSPTSSSSPSSSTASTSSPPSSSSTRPPSPSPSPSRRRLVRQRSAVGGARCDGVVDSTGQDSKCVPTRGGRSPAIEGVNEGLEGCTDRTPSDRPITTGGRGWRPTDHARSRATEGCGACANENERE